MICPYLWFCAPTSESSDLEWNDMFSNSDSICPAVTKLLRGKSLRQYDIDVNQLVLRLAQLSLSLFFLVIEDSTPVYVLYCTNHSWIAYHLHWRLEQGCLVTLSYLANKAFRLALARCGCDYASCVLLRERNEWTEVGNHKGESFGKVLLCHYGEKRGEFPPSVRLGWGILLL